MLENTKTVRVKILKIHFNYDYVEDKQIQSIVDDLPWVEVNPVFLERLKKALPKKRHLKAKDPFYGHSVVLLEEVVEPEVSLEEFVCSIEKLMEKEEESKRKREEARKAAEQRRQEIALERKRKQLEKLKKELEG